MRMLGRDRRRKLLRNLSKEHNIALSRVYDIYEKVVTEWEWRHEQNEIYKDGNEKSTDFSD